MALMRDLSKAQLAFQVAGGEVDQFEVLRYRGTEGLGQLYRFEIELATSEEKLAFDDIIGKPAVLSINTDFGERWFHGIVGRFEMTGETTGQTYFRAELVPSVWLLTHRYNSRIFQQKATPEIISDVLTQAAIAGDRFSLELLTRTYEPREYCVQYRETDYNFISRLMEEEGIRWYFEHNQEGHVLVLEDGEKATYSPIEGDAVLPYKPPTGLLTEQEHISRFRLGQSVRPGAVVLDDFNFKNPKLDLQTCSDCGRDGALEFYDYPGEYVQQKHGRDLVTVRAEEFEASRTVGVGQSNSPRLVPGKSFNLNSHPGGLDGWYLITSVTHQGKQSTTRASTGGNGQAGILDARLHQSLMAARQNENTTIRELADALLQIAARLHAGDPTAHRALTDWLYHAGQVSRDLPSIAEALGGNPLEALSIPNLLEDIATSSLVDWDAPVYECRFECIPASVTFRPPRIAPWPVMRGTQTARVVGPQGEEIHTDEYGRVKVQFNWDREGKYDEESSCWIRVSQGSAGGQYGAMFLPRVGQEVIVDFLEGDPDKPIITGRVYNADQMPPYELPKEKTKSVIKTHSSKGGGGTNEIRFEDLKGKEQLLIYAHKDLHFRANNDRVENVGHDHHLTVKENKFELVKQGKNTEVKLDYNEKIGGKKSLKVVGDIAEYTGGSHSEKVGANYYVSANTNLVLEAGVNLTLKVGGNSIALTGAGIFISGSMVYINSGSGSTSGQSLAVKPAEAPVDADSVQPGKDVTYSRDEELGPGEADPDVAGITFEPEEREQDTSWIEIELVDELGLPVPSEAYEVKDAGEEIIRRGNLDVNGQAHVSVPTSGTYLISFPNLDMAAWARAGGSSQAPEPGGQPAAGPPGEAPQSGSQGDAFMASEPSEGEEEEMQLNEGLEDDDEESQMSQGDEGEEELQM